VAVRTVHRVEDRVVLSVSRNTMDRSEGSKNNTLFNREFEVLLLMARAMSNSQIASQLHMSSHQHLRETGRSRADAANEAPRAA
jgi:DNA-binding NarL/FixJ family response regulator